MQVQQRTGAELQKSFLESKGWKCSRCSSCKSTVAYDCLNNKYKGYMITLKGSIARIIMKGRIISSSPVYDIQKKMKEQNIF